MKKILIALCTLFLSTGCAHAIGNQALYMDPVTGQLNVTYGPGGIYNGFVARSGQTIDLRLANVLMPGNFGVTGVQGTANQILVNGIAGVPYAGQLTLSFPTTVVLTNISATGTTTLNTSWTGLLKATAGVLSTATAGTDYAPATTGTQILYGNGTGGFSLVTIGANLSFSGGVLSASGGGSAVAAGSPTWVQYNVGGALAANSGFTSDTSGNVSVNTLVSGNGVNTSGSTNGFLNSGTFANTNTGTAAGSQINVYGNSSSGIQILATSTNYTGAVFSGGPTGWQAGINTTSGQPLVIGISGTAVGFFNTHGLNAAAIGYTTPSTGAFTTLSATGTTTLATSLTGLLKATAGVVSAAVAGTDYAAATSGSSILYGNGAGGFSNVTVGTNLSFSTGTLSVTAPGSNHQVILNNSGSLGTLSTFTCDQYGQVTLTNVSAGGGNKVTETNNSTAWLLTNTTAATLGNPQGSPIIEYIGHSWNTNTHSSVELDAYECLVGESSANANGYWQIQSNSGTALSLNLNVAASGLALGEYGITFGDSSFIGSYQTTGGLVLTSVSSQPTTFFAGPTGSSGGYNFYRGANGSAPLCFNISGSTGIPSFVALSSNGVLTTTGGTGTLSVIATTGSGSAVLATSPTLVTPVLGIATGTSISVTGSFTTTAIGGTLHVKSGSNSKSGSFTLASGVATVSNTSITANSVIHATLQPGGLSGTITGALYYPTTTASTGFNVAETGGTSDNSTYNYWIEENN